MYSTDDTIAAIASAPGGAARGIVRLSGLRVREALGECFCTEPPVSLSCASQPTVLSGRIELSGAASRRLPADVYYWPDQRSYTRQPAAEIHTLGSPPLLSAVLQTVCSAGARPAEPGEFTLRAFLAGRLDLTQAEAVLGVIDARGERQLQWALEQLAGGLSRPLGRLRESLLELLAHLEAGLDFVEEDIEFVNRRQMASHLNEAAHLLHRTGAQLIARRRNESLPRVALVGWPNVGKSSLFNALADTAALVSDEPGTTRDYLTATLQWDDVACQLVDTAGYDAAVESGAIAHTARHLATAQAAACDVELLCLDVTRPLNAWEITQRAEAPEAARLVVGTKADQARHVAAPQTDVTTSATSGSGLSDLRHRLKQAIESIEQNESAAGLTAERSAESLRAACEAVDRARALNAAAGGEELIAAELRIALAELGKVIGAVYTDDILDRVFSRFCIGK